MAPDLLHRLPVRHHAVLDWVHDIDVSSRRLHLVTNKTPAGAIRVPDNGRKYGARSVVTGPTYIRRY